MAHVDVNWCAADTTIPFDPIVTDGTFTTQASWPPPSLRANPSICCLFSHLGNSLLSKRSIFAARSTTIETTTIHFGISRHIDTVQIFWGAFEENSEAHRRYGLFPLPGTLRPVEIVTVDGARCVLLPSTLASNNVPKSNFMSRVRMWYEHEGSISTYKIPTHMMKQGLLSIMLFETREFREGGVPIRQIKVSS